MFSPVSINASLAGQSDVPNFVQISRILTHENGGSSNAYLLSYDQGIQAINSGVGAMVGIAKFGEHTRWKYSMMYNYKITISRNSQITLGGTVFMDYRSTFFDKIAAGLPNSTLPDRLKSTYLNYDLGIAGNFGRTVFGLSLYNFYSFYGDIGVDEFSYEYNNNRQPILFLSREFDLGQLLTLNPSILYIPTSNLPDIINLNSTLNVGHRAFIGAQYSNNNTIGNTSNIFAGLTLLDAVNLGVKVFARRPSQYPNRYRCFAFVVQVNPKKNQKRDLADN